MFISNAFLRAIVGAVLFAILATAALRAGIAQEKPRDIGIGGTGAFGEITKFGSVFVNGVEFELKPDQPLDTDAFQDMPPSLQIGQVLRLASLAEGHRIGATSLSLEHEVIGQIESYDADKATLQILGQRIDVSNVADKSVLAVGAWVAVSGFRDGEAVVHARLVEPSSAGRFQVIANVESQPDFAKSALTDAGLDGRAIVRGKFSDGAPKVEAVLRWSYFDDVAKPMTAKIEGYFAIAVGERIDLANPQFRADAQPKVADGFGRGLATPELSVITVIREHSGSYVVAKIEPSKKVTDVDEKKKKKDKDRDAKGKK